jgi:hypothetical protein
VRTSRTMRCRPCPPAMRRRSAPRRPALSLERLQAWINADARRCAPMLAPLEAGGIGVHVARVRPARAYAVAGAAPGVSRAASAGRARSASPIATSGRSTASTSRSGAVYDTTVVYARRTRRIRSGRSRAADRAGDRAALAAAPPDAHDGPRSSPASTGSRTGSNRAVPVSRLEVQGGGHGRRERPPRRARDQDAGTGRGIADCARKLRESGSRS